MTAVRQIFLYCSALAAWLVPLDGRAAAQSPPGAEQVLEVRIVGNRVIPTHKVLSEMQTRAGRPFNQRIIEEDIRRLHARGWFLNVKPSYQQQPGGRIVIFTVVERPTLRYVQYLGNRNIKDKTLNKETGLRVGDAVDPYAIEEARRKIEQYYHEHGYNKATVKILEGTNHKDRGAVFIINEGQLQRVFHVRFIGNTIASDARLRTQIMSKPGWFWFIKGYVDPRKIDEDVDRLTSYYRSLGFFRARISREMEYGESGRWLTLTFVVDEGPRYQVRNVSFVGNKLYKTDRLLGQVELKAGKFFNQTEMTKDVNTLQEIYGSQGYVFADVKADPRFLEEPGQLDLVYDISEGQRYRVGRIRVHIEGENPHTRRQTILNRLSIRPGDVVDIRELRASERRLKSAGIFANDLLKGEVPRIVFTPPGMDTQVAESGDRFRGQSPDPPQPAPGEHVVDVNLYYEKPDQPPRVELRDSHPRARADTPRRGTGDLMQRSPAAPNRLQTAPNTRPATTQPAPRSDAVVRAQSPDRNGAWQYTSPNQYGGRGAGGIGPSAAPRDVYSSTPGSYRAQSPQPTGTRADYAGPTGRASQAGPYVGSGPAPGQQVALPYGSTSGGVPLFGEPTVQDYAEPLYPEPLLDLDVWATETQTGRLMLGVGVNSDAGVVGSFTVDEQNFDWRRWPRSFEEIRNGTAFRGAGQRFRLELMPGSQVQRYLVSFQEPYLLDTAVGLSLSGFYFDRIYRDWSEQRLGGRVGLSYQLTPDLSAGVSYRGESVTVFDPRIPTPPELEDVLGDNALHGFKGTLTHDTRDNAFLPTEGHFLQGSLEQVIGTYQYPRAELDARQYYLIRQRPDGSGRHVVSMTGRVGWSGSDTPLYDHFFAGGFSTFRGYSFRGMGPRTLGVAVGGEFMLLGSVEYLVPITADDMLRGVFFCDFGTVEREVEINDFRVSPGFGLRVTIPAMGPAPIALDFAFPVRSFDGDDEQMFSFNIGFLR